MNVGLYLGTVIGPASRWFPEQRQEVRRTKRFPRGVPALSTSFHVEAAHSGSMLLPVWLSRRRMKSVRRLTIPLACARTATLPLCPPTWHVRAEIAIAVDHAIGKGSPPAAFAPRLPRSKVRAAPRRLAKRGVQQLHVADLLASKRPCSLFPPPPLSLYLCVHPAWRSATRDKKAAVARWGEGHGKGLDLLLCRSELRLDCGWGGVANGTHRDDEEACARGWVWVCASLLPRERRSRGCSKRLFAALPYFFSLFFF